MATDDGIKTWKGITWSRGERFPGARGKNRGILYTHRLNKRIKAELMAEESAERARLRAIEAAKNIQSAICPTCGSDDVSVRLQLAVSFGDAEQASKTVQCAHTYHGKKPNRKKRHKFVPPNGGELIEKVL